MADRLLRVNQIVKNSKTGFPGLIPICKSSWWEGVRIGKFPQPIKIGGATCWRESDVMALIYGNGV